MKPVVPHAPKVSKSVPPLRHGQRLTQAEFHRRYLTYPDHVVAELIGGVVYIQPPNRLCHGRYSAELGGVLANYGFATPGVQALGSTTTILGEQSELQPDKTLRIMKTYGGRSSENEDGFVQGPAELVAEIAYSRADVDLREKRADYEQAGIQEYLVLCIAEQELHWFHFPSQEPVIANRRGIARSRVFPGLWLDVPALLARKSARLIATLQRGLASREHAAFVKRLARVQRSRS
jgi:Uma2 family endonuclease